MSAKVQVKVKSVTGRRVRYYPVGENAKHVVALIKKKTLSELARLQRFEGSKYPNLT